MRRLRTQSCGKIARRFGGGRGFTLVEAAVAIVIVGVMFVAAITTVASAAQSRRVIAGWRRADGLARALLYEAEQCPYGTTGGSIVPVVVITVGTPTRASFTTIDDYNGYSESSATAQDGTALTGYAGWQRSVLVERVDPADPLGSSTRSTDKGMKRITVTVRAPTGETTSLTALRSRWSIADLDGTPGTRRAQAVTIHLRTSGGVDLYSGALVPNGPDAGTAVAAAAADPKDVTAPEATGVGGLVTTLLGGLLGGGK